MDYRIIADETNAYLIERDGKSLLIDCPCTDAAGRIAALGAPLPDTILHTQVQEEHCREWGSLPAADVYVHEESVEVAKRSPAFFAACKTIWPPDRPWEGDTMGTEKYGVAGCTTERPPEVALNVAGSLRPGQVFHWEGVELDIVDLPGCGRRSLGFFWREKGILFAGDLLRAGGFMVNLYDCERSYGGTLGYRETIVSLAKVRELGPRVILPSTGPSVTDPDGDCARLTARWDRVLNPPAIRRRRKNPRPIRELGLFKEIRGGVYQNCNGGNMILFIDREGRGLLIDPDPCIWFTWEDNCRRVHAQLDLLEKEAGLKSIEHILLTHYHGDHVQYCDLIRERYGAKVYATPDVAAIVERPWEFRYPCCIDWYGFPFDHVNVDETLSYGAVHMWHDVPVTPIHTPGHCFAHTGYIIDWEGVRCVSTGDTLQTGPGGDFATPLPVMYNDTAWPVRGTIRTLEKLLEVKPDIVLGGHSAWIATSCDEVLSDCYEGAVSAFGRVAALLHDGDLMRAMAPPGYDDKRPVRFRKRVNDSGRR